MQTAIVGQRLLNQKLVRSDLKKPVEIVSWLGAVQSQDYTGAKWALALRAPALTDADVDRAFDRGDILRTHMLRPTWHFVAPQDIRWMLALTAPRVLAGNRHYCRKNGLDDKTLARCRKVMERALAGGRHLTRAALAAVLERAGIAGAGQRLAYLVMDAELERVICSGPRLGKQFTYALLEERAPKTPALTNDEALAELTKRYFASHGPATLRDFVWWSGLTVKLAKSGLEMLGRAVACETVNGVTYWSVPPARPRRATAPTATPLVYLLPNYDELMNALRDRGLFRDPAISAAGRRIPAISAPARDRRHPARRLAADAHQPGRHHHGPAVQAARQAREAGARRRGLALRQVREYDCDAGDRVGYFRGRRAS